MLEQLVDVVSSLLLIALTIGALAPSIRLASGGDPARPGPHPVLWGVVLGAVAALGLIVLHQTSIVRFDRQKLTLTTLEPTVALFFCCLAVIWINGRKTVAALRETKSDGLVVGGIANPLRPLWVKIASLAGFAWAAMIVFRNSQSAYLQLWTFVPASSSVFSTATFLNVLGYVLGLVLVVVAGFSVMLIIQHRPGYGPWLVSIIGGCLSASHIFLIIRLLYSLRAIYLNRDAANAMSWLVNHEFIFTFVGLGALIAAAGISWINAGGETTEDDDPARLRLKLAREKSVSRRSMLALGSAALALGILTVGKRFANQEVELSEPEPYDVQGENVVVSLDAISDGHLHRFEYPTSSGPKVRFIVIQKAGTSFGVGLDACEICGASGYYEKDGKVICKLCEVAMNIATIGFKGGCNPIPIDFTVANGVLSVPIAVLEANASIFA